MKTNVKQINNHIHGDYAHPRFLCKPAPTSTPCTHAKDERACLSRVCLTLCMCV